MAEPIGGLSAIAPNTQQEEIVSTPEPQVDPLAIARAEYDKVRRSLIAQQRALVESLESRVSQPADMLLSLSAGFGAPTRGGGFGESFSTAAQGLQKYRSEEDARTQQLAKMRLELGQQEAGLAKENLLAQAASQMFGGVGAAGSAGAAGGMGGMVPASVQPILRTMLALDPQKAIDFGLKIAQDEAKRPDAVKALEAYVNMLPLEQQAAARQYFASTQIYGKPEDKVTAEKTIRDLVAQQRISPEEGEARIAQLRGAPSAFAQPVAKPSIPGQPSAKFEGDPAAVFAEINRIEDPVKRDEVKQAYIRQLSGQTAEPKKPFVPKTEQEIAIETAEAQEAGKLNVKRKADIIQSLSDANDQASQNIRNAEQVYKIVEQNPKGFGLLSKPGWDSALGYLAETGLRVGPYNVSIADVKGAMLRSGKFTQEEINAVSQVQQIAIQTQLALASGAKGSVSNFERQLFADAAGISISDNPKVIQYKSELIRVANNRSKELWNAWRQFSKSGKGDIDDFKESDSWSQINNKYDGALNRLREAYGR